MQIATAIISGLTLGFVGSFHCIGMCGPIALSLPIHHQSSFQKMWSISLYHFGRASTYAILGFIFGALGFQVQYFGFQQLFSILLGVGLLISLFFANYFTFNNNFFSTFLLRIKQKLGQLLQSAHQSSGFYLVGLLNGLLPCGMVYVAIVAALATGNILTSTTLLFSFGLGTLPLMTALMLFQKFIPLQIRQHLKKVTPVFVSLLAVFLIIRGLNLDIPFLSPIFPFLQKEIPMCGAHG